MRVFTHVTLPRPLAPPRPAPPERAPRKGRGLSGRTLLWVGGASSAQAHRRVSPEEQPAAVTSAACARVLEPLESGTRVAVCESLLPGD